MTDFVLDGVPTRVEAELRVPLLYVLRNDCERKGVRFGCGTGQCGACTVLIDGTAEQSCQTALSIAEGRQVMTPDALAQDAVGAVVLQAFIDEQAAQCGYCISGMLMSLTGLLKRHSAPDDAMLHECLGRHLCRCGTHLRIMRAARLAISRMAAVH